MPMTTTYVTGRVDTFSTNVGEVEGSLVGDALIEKLLEEVGGTGREEGIEGETTKSPPHHLSTHTYT